MLIYEVLVQVLGKKRHASEQTGRTAPPLELVALSQDDLGLREKGTRYAALTLANKKYKQSILTFLEYERVLLQI